MISRTVTKHNLDASLEIKQNLQYWLTRPPEERLAAVDSLRAQIYGDNIRLKRVVSVVNQNEKALGRKKDLADLEALGL